MREKSSCMSIQALNSLQNISRLKFLLRAESMPKFIYALIRNHTNLGVKSMTSSHGLVILADFMSSQSSSAI